MGVEAKLARILLYVGSNAVGLPCTLITYNIRCYRERNGASNGVEAKTERFEMRFDQATLQRLDEWRGRQGEIPSRAEAIRRLIDTALSAKSDRNVQFSDGERLILYALCDIHKALEIDDGIDVNLITKALIGGHHWALRWEYGGTYLHQHEDDPQVARDVANILDMWLFIERGYDRLTKKEKARVSDETGKKNVKFIGFDGNNEGGHYSVTYFMVNDLKRFEHFAGRDFNSHTLKVGTYLRMLRVFEPIRDSLVGRGLDASQIIELLNA